MKKLKFLTGSIRSKLTTLLISAAMLPLIVIIIIGLGQARKLLNDKDYLHLEAIGVLKKQNIVSFFENTERELTTMSADQITREASKQFNELLKSPTFQSAGKFNTQSRQYQELLARFNSHFQGFVSSYKLNDFYLFSPEQGFFLYAASNYNQLGKSLLSLELKNTAISEVYSEVLQAKSIRMSDIQQDALTGKNVFYLGAPIFNASGVSLGIIVVEIDASKITGLVEESAGLGKTGESYLVGSDYLMRSNSRFNSETDILNTLVDTENVHLGFQKQTGKLSLKSYRNRSVLSFFIPIDLDLKFNAGFDWILIVEIEESEAFMAFKGLVIQMIIIAAVMFILIAVAAAFFARYFTKPIFQLKEITTQIANGDLTQSTDIGQDDEVGKLAESIKLMRENLRSQLEEMYEGTNVLSTSSAQLMSMVSQLASGSAETATSVSETTATVEEVKQTVEISNQKSVEVANSSQRMMEVSEQGKNSVNETIKKMSNIKQQMESIGGIVIQLSDKGNTIGDIVTNVNDLAEQSNLLAVNASIEAAKAGEQGKGFAVVAQEIKNLSERSKMATVQIKTILSDIQKEISSAVLATEQGTKAIDEGLIQSSNASEVIAALVSSVELSAQSNIQIAASSQQQMVGMDQIAAAMENIKEASVQTAQSIKQSEDSVGNLKNLGERLLAMLNKYKLN